MSSDVGQGADETREILEFFFDLFENHKETLVYYLSEAATLDWFGQTVKGEKNIVAFLKTKVGKIRHLFSNPAQVANIGYRDSHVVKALTNLKVAPLKIDDAIVTQKEITPINEDVPIPSSSHFVEKGQGDGLHNCPVNESPVKKFRLNAEEISEPLIKYISADGHVEFQKRSTKKLQQESKWSRPCKLEFAYSGSNKKDFVLYLIIYQGNTRCRRNLLKEFEASGPPSN